MKKVNIENLEESLNIQYAYCKECDPTMKDEQSPSWIYYKGMLRTIELLGMSWERLKSGKHIIYK